MIVYDGFNEHNIALAGSRDIGVFQNGKKIGRIPLGSLRQPNRGRRLYSFGVISDVEIGQSGADTKFREALTYLRNDKDVEFVTICGDLVEKIAQTESPTKKKPWFEDYQKIVKECCGDKAVFAIGGNHEQWCDSTISGYMKDYTGNQTVWYHQNFEDDVFLFLGIEEYVKANGGVDHQAYKRSDVIGINNFLSANRNKRCFIFQHFPLNGGEYEYDISRTDYAQGNLPLSLFRHYKNVTVFHGHTHSPFSVHKSNKGANFNKKLGFRSVHVPGLCDHCEGYVVDVYADGIHLRGLNFETGYIPIASYWVDTTIVDVSGVYPYKKEE